MCRRESLVLSLTFVGWLGCTGQNADAPNTEQSQHALGTGLFESPISLAVGSWPSAVAIADVNGDGANEVLMTTNTYFDATNDYKLMIFRHDASGVMQEIARYDIGRGAESMSVGDVNGDGRTDVVVANNYSDTIGIFYQNASGTLDPMVTIATTSSLRVRVADLNGDGRQDIVGIDWGTDIVDLFLQDEQGQLSGRATYHVSHGGYDDLEVGDVNHDGRTDIVVMSGQSYISNLGVILQTPEGAFEPPVYYSVGPLSANTLTHGVAIGDVNGDGRQDVIVSYGGNRPTSKLGVFIQNETGALDPAQSLDSYDIPEPVVAADVDHNGATDILVLHGGWNALGVYSQTNAGALDAEARYSVPYASHYPPDALAVGDFTGDGLPDVAIADYNHGLVTLEHLGMPADTQPPVLSVAAPTGQVIQAGSPVRIAWTASDDVGLAGFDVLFSPDGGTTTTPIAECTGLGPALRACTWAAGGPANPSALVRVVARDSSGNTASADAVFVIAPPPDTIPPTVSVLTPVGSTAYTGMPLSITWDASDDVALGSFDVQFSTDGGATTTAIPACTGLGPDARSCSWASPGPASATAAIRVVAWDAAGNSTSSDGAFVLAQPELTVAAEQVWTIGTEQTLSWTHNLPADDAMRIELSRDGGASWEVVSASTPNTGSYVITVTGPAAQDARVRVTWSANPSVKATTTLAILPANTPPTVTAGSDQVISLPGTASLSGSATDDGLPDPPGAVTTTWSQVDGPGTVAFADPAALSTAASFSTSGNYTLRLTASDGSLSSTDDVVVTVIAEPVNTPPVVNAGTDRAVTLPASVALVGMASDDGLPNPPGGLITTWSMVDGPGTVTFADPAALSTTATFSLSGNYTLRLTANDGVLASSDEIVVTVNPPTNTAPTVNAGADQTITLPASATLAGTASDDGLPDPPSNLTITWSKVSGPGTVTFANPSAPSTTATFSVSGSYTLRLTGNDGALAASDDVIVTVIGSPASACSGLCSNPVNFTINGSYWAGNFGTGAACYQTTSTIHGGVCGNIVSPRTLKVNGTTENCNGSSWTVPAKRNGGYCIQVTAGNYPWAYFATW
jgi:hypothetical protein